MTLFPYTTLFRSEWRNHSNLSWKQQNPPNSSANYWKNESQHQRPYQEPPFNAQPNRNPIEETLQAFMETQMKTNQMFECMLTQVVEENKEIKNQITKLTSALEERGRFPSQPQPSAGCNQNVQSSVVESQNIKEINFVSTCNGEIVEDPSSSSPSSMTNTNRVLSDEGETRVIEGRKVPVTIDLPQALNVGRNSVSNQEKEYRKEEGHDMKDTLFDKGVHLNHNFECLLRDFHKENFVFAYNDSYIFSNIGKEQEQWRYWIPQFEKLRRENVKLSSTKAHEVGLSTLRDGLTHIRSGPTSSIAFLTNIYNRQIYGDRKSVV